MQVRLDTVYVYQSELAIGLRELENCLKREKNLSAIAEYTLSAVFQLSGEQRSRAQKGLRLGGYRHVLHARAHLQ